MANPAPTWGDRFTRRRFVDAVTDTLTVVGTAARLLVRHWPVLLALVLGGVAARQLAIRVAVEASAVSAELGWLVLMLAPLAWLTALVLMLRAVRPSLPGLGAAPGQTHPSLLDHLGSVLVPFLTVYYAYEYLTQDISDYAYAVLEDETFSNAAIFAGAETDPLDRLPLDLDLTLVAVVAVAMGLRWLLSRWPATERHGWLGIPGAYLEALWITLVTTAAFGVVWDSTVDWVSHRQAVDHVQSMWTQALTALGPFGGPVEAVTAWLGEQMGHLDAVILLPLGWLAIGAVVYGDQMSVEPTAAEAVPVRAWRAAPLAFRRAAIEFVGERFEPLVHGWQLLMRAGLSPILLFCLAFVVADSTADWLWELERLLIGPQDLQTFWWPLSGPLSTLNDAATTVLVVCLVAAAVDRALSGTRPAPAQPGAGSSQA